jgi:NAD-dependent deacetylase
MPVDLVLARCYYAGMNREQTAAEAIRKASRIAVLTGAGISTDSGIPDFRSGSESFWNANKDRASMMTLDYLQAKPKLFWPAFKEIFKLDLPMDFRPNKGHLFLKALEDMGKSVTIITQNADGLHQAAGSTRVLEIHGSMDKAFCPKCKASYGIDYIRSQPIPRCSNQRKGKDCGFILHPDVVLFGDTVRFFKEAEEAVLKSDLFMTIGTSLLVAPVKFLPYKAASSNPDRFKIIINRDPTSFDHCFNLVFNAGISETSQSILDILGT